MGDWNARTGTLSGVDISDGGSRQSMDTMLDKEGEDMIELMEEFGYGVLNGRTKGDWTGQITHVDYRSKSVIDYAACNELLINYISEMKVGDKTQSDHFPIEIELNIGSQQTNHVEEAKWIPNYSPQAMLLYRRGKSGNGSSTIRTGGQQSATRAGEKWWINCGQQGGIQKCTHNISLPKESIRPK